MCKSVTYYVATHLFIINCYNICQYTNMDMSCINVCMHYISKVSLKLATLLVTHIIYLTINKMVKKRSRMNECRPISSD